MHVLVAGGAGYIGSTLVPLLLELGHSVVVLDRFYFGREALHAAAQRFGERLTLRCVDMRGVTPDMLSGVDAVVDLAGISNDPACELRAELTRAINYDGALRLARAARSRGVKHYIFASSCSVYGQGHELELREDSALHPVSLYAHCKVDVERELPRIFEGGDTVWTILRFATVFGYSPRMRFDLAVNIMTQNAYLDRRIRVFGGGVQWRPFVHVADVSRAITLVLGSDAPRVHGKVFNVGDSKNNIQIKNLAFRVRDILPQTEVEMLESDPDARNYNVNFDAITAQLGFQVQRSIEDGVQEVVSALRGGLSPGDRRWYTLKQYMFLQEMEQAYRELAVDGNLLSWSDDAPR